MRRIFGLFLFISASLFIGLNAQTADNPNSPNFHNTKIFRYFQIESNFGANTVNIGDFNADGIEDVAISADNENDAEGKVRIYFGNKNFDSDPDVTFNPPYGYTDFGAKVSSAGDFNGDGFDDIVIVAKNYPTENPQVLIYFGGPLYDTEPDVALENYWNTVGFGDDVAGLGDINGDGFDDIAVISGMSVGIYYGSSNPSEARTMDDALNHGGDNVEFCGDVNGDGFNDILVANTLESIAMVYKGGTELNHDPAQFFGSYNSGTPFGYSMSAGGDVNGDGFSDIIIGDMGGSFNYGSAYVYFGNAQILDYGMVQGYPADLTLSGMEESSNFGSAVAMINDMNGDGFDEFAVGGSNLNYLNLYMGNIRPTATVAQIYHSQNTETGYFFTISSLDFNGDGYNEIIAGDYENDIVYLFNNQYEGVVWGTDIQLPDELSGDISGDFNGDGKKDLLSSNSIYSGIYNISNGIPEVTFFTLLRKGFMEFFRRAVLKKGYRDGMTGLVEAIIQGINRVFVYIQVWELQQTPSIEERSTRRRALPIVIP